jgi:glycosyltransferase involved in cell wall biosynthesis
MAVAPAISIVIPTFDRTREAARAVRSCLTQRYEDFEVVVVDDGSSRRLVDGDLTRGDQRVRVVRQDRNRGVCPARNRGVEESRGEWLVFLDSDWSLLDGALALIARETNAADESTGRIWFMQRWDDGRVSPSPALRAEVLDYEGHVRWVERSYLYDALSVARRRTFEVCRYPEDRSWEFGYNLDFAKRFLTRCVPEFAAVQHTDASNRLTGESRGQLNALLRETERDNARELDRMMVQHADALHRWAPEKYRLFQRARVMAHLIGGARLKALRLGAANVAEAPMSVRAWTGLMAACAGPAVSVRVRAMRQRKHNLESMSRRLLK